MRQAQEKIAVRPGGNLYFFGGWRAAEQKMNERASVSLSCAIPSSVSSKLVPAGLMRIGAAPPMPPRGDRRDGEVGPRGQPAATVGQRHARVACQRSAST